MKETSTGRTCSPSLCDAGRVEQENKTEALEPCVCRRRAVVPRCQRSRQTE